MKYKTKALTSTPEILKRECGGEYSKPITLASSAFTNGLCKAGTPINADGEIATTSSDSNNAVGILWNDVYDVNPNGSIIVAFAVINATVAQAHSSVTYDAPMKAALPLLIFE